MYSRTQLSVTDEHVIDHASLRYNDESCSSIDDTTAESILFSATASYRYGRYGYAYVRVNQLPMQGRF